MSRHTRSDAKWALGLLTCILAGAIGLAAALLGSWASYNNWDRDPTGFVATGLIAALILAIIGGCTMDENR